MGVGGTREGDGEKLTLAFFVQWFEQWCKSHPVMLAAAKVTLDAWRSQDAAGFVRAREGAKAWLRDAKTDIDKAMAKGAVDPNARARWEAWRGIFVLGSLLESGQMLGEIAAEVWDHFREFAAWVEIANQPKPCASGECLDRCLDKVRALALRQVFEAFVVVRNGGAS